ncbi:MAG TPA: hypothetical protein PLN24_08180 [Victivallales bacterium]|nr:hypothetical protein [Victivallales bacterium]
MRKGSIAMLALAMIIAGMGKAGEYGKVTLSKEVYEVGEKGATVTVTDGTGGYKAGAGKGFGKVDASFTGKGTHPITISNKPSEELNDSGVTVTYPSPQTGEEEKGVTSYCTVVKLTADIDGSGKETIIQRKDKKFRLVNVRLNVAGEALPVGFGSVKVEIFAPKQTGLLLWRPAEQITKYGTPPSYSVKQRFHLSNYFREDFYKPTRFDVTVTYAGIRATDYTLILYDTIFIP